MDILKKERFLFFKISQFYILLDNDITSVTLLKRTKLYKVNFIFINNIYHNFELL